MENPNQRECGTCNLCCKLPYIENFKPQYKWCSNCEIGVGCKIYETRPKKCKDFYCRTEWGEMEGPLEKQRLRLNGRTF